ncbi:MAG: ribonuclease P protein component [Mycobacterium sp.]
MLPAQYRMTRSADFGATVKQGRRAAQPDVVVYSRVIHSRRTAASSVGEPTAEAPRVGLIIAKSVGSAVDRHRVARRLRHVTRDLLADLQPAEQLVIRALPSSNRADSDALRTQLRAGLRAVHRSGGATR